MRFCAPVPCRYCVVSPILRRKFGPDNNFPIRSQPLAFRLYLVMCRQIRVDDFPLIGLHGSQRDRRFGGESLVTGSLGLSFEDLFLLGKIVIHVHDETYFFARLASDQGSDEVLEGRQIDTVLANKKILISSELN